MLILLIQPLALVFDLHFCTFPSNSVTEKTSGVWFLFLPHCNRCVVWTLVTVSTSYAITLRRRRPHQGENLVHIWFSAFFIKPADRWSQVSPSFACVLTENLKVSNQASLIWMIIRAWLSNTRIHFTALVQIPYNGLLDIKYDIPCYFACSDTCLANYLIRSTFWLWTYWCTSL